jgi:hypothetical protein
MRQLSGIEHTRHHSRRCGRKRPRTVIAAAMIALLLVGCQAVPRTDPADMRAGGRTMSATQAYAGDILGHMMAVVTGSAGPVAGRRKWRSRGLTVPLVFSEIQKSMADPDFDKSRVLVYDSEIIGLSRVLYHYDPLLNQFKGRKPFFSPFPSDELIALRLLLIGKIARDETIQLDEIDRRLPAIMSGGDISAQDCEAMGLSETEAQLLADAFRSEPSLMAYFHHPAVVQALGRMGVIDEPPTHGPDYPGAAFQTLPTGALAAISVLPSFMTAFTPAQTTGGDILVATDTYRRRAQSLKDAITASSGKRMIQALMTRHPTLDVKNNSRWETRWATFVDSRVAFFIPEAHPLAITPFNAGAVIERVSPIADINVILVGKDAMRSMDLRPGRDSFPQTRQLYVDAADVKYGVIEETVDTVSEWLVERTLAAIYRELAEASALSSIRLDHVNGLDRAVVGAESTGDTCPGVRESGVDPGGIRLGRIVQGQTIHRTGINADVAGNALFPGYDRHFPGAPESDALGDPLVGVQDGPMRADPAAGPAVDAPVCLNVMTLSGFPRDAGHRTDLPADGTSHALVRDAKCHRPTPR